MNQPFYIMGDLHGYLELLISHLQATQLIDEDYQWCGDDARLWFVGDFVDRGPDGIGCIDLVMRLQREAADVGGEIGAVIGNHDIAFLAAQLIPDKLCNGPGETFYEDWLRFGNPRDAQNVRSHHLDWLMDLPAMTLVDDCLIIHGDCPLYLEWGASLEDVNVAFRDALHSDNPALWDRFLDGFDAHHWFYEDPNINERLTKYFATFGGSTLIHGHTPIGNITGDHPSVTSAFVYAEGAAINVDGGMYKGGPGFIHKISG